MEQNQKNKDKTFAADVPLKQYLSGEVDLLELYQTVIRQQLALIDSNRYKLRIPKVRDEMKFIPNSHFHIYPEMFLQISGMSEFRFPRGKFRLYPGEICVMPRTITHAEKTWRWGGPFHNLVIVPGKNTPVFHISQANKIRKPCAMETLRFEAGGSNRLSDYLDNLVEVFHGNSPVKKLGIKGLLLAEFSAILEWLEGTRPVTGKVHFTITKCRQQIVDDFANPDLSVKYLARLVGCSADYLSNIFHRETGVRLTVHINNERIIRAKYLLKTTSLNISETARACGYRDPCYFTRIFRRVAGKTPRDFRNFQ